MLQPGDERHRLSIERVVFVGGRRTQMRLQRDVPEILQSDDAEPFE